MTTPLLDDDRYLAFLRDGFVVVQPELDDAVHERLYAAARSIYEESGKPGPLFHLDQAGDNVRARIPEVESLLQDRAVRGAVESLVGPEPLLHPHSFIHAATRRDQPFHKDGNLPWNERGHVRTHRPDWILLFYYPQAVDATNGPTEVLAGTQYWSADHERDDGTWHPDDSFDRSFLNDGGGGGKDLAARDARLRAMIDGFGVPDLERRFVHLPRGSVVLAHYDVAHRGSRAALEAAPRFMFKFHYARTHHPERPAWACTAREPDVSGMRPELGPVVEALWSWSSGRSVARPERALENAAELRAEGEHERIACAYTLGASAAAGDSDALGALAAALEDPREAVRRAAGYGLGIVGAPAAAPLVEASGSARAATRRVVAFALGAQGSIDPSVIDTLLALLTDPDDLVRSNAAAALGALSRDSEAPAGPIVDALLDRLEPGVEPDNTRSAGLSRSTVREEVATALVQAAANHSLDAARCRRLAELGLRAEDRYVTGLTVDALMRQDAAPQDVMLRFLSSRAFHPVPTLGRPGSDPGSARRVDPDR